jgi:hypothetical protein
MKLIKHNSIMKHLLPALLSLLAIGLLAACGGYDQTTTQSQNPLTSENTAQTLALSQTGAFNNQPQGNYPDPTNQKALPKSVQVTEKGATVLLRASVTEGYQIYECQASTTAASGFAWTLQAPFAFLKADAGTNVIHSTGPAWLYTLDGSEIQAKLGTFTQANGSVVPASATPDASAVPWLRLDVTQHQGKTGLFSNVDQVQRLYTHNGKAPSTSCNQDAANHHTILPVSYTAEYVFWGHKN